MVAPNRMSRMVQRRRRIVAEWAFFYAVNFATVAQAGNQGGNTRIDAETDFMCLALHLGVYFSSTVNLTTTAGISGLANLNGVMGKFSRYADPTAARNSNGHLGHITLNIQTNDRPWMNTPIRADQLCGEPGSVFYLPKPIRISAGSTIVATLFNNLPASIGGVANAPIDAQLIFIGEKQRIGQG